MLPLVHLLSGSRSDRLRRSATALLAAAFCIAIASCDSGSDDNPLNASAFSAAGSDEPFSSTVYPEPRLLTSDSPSVFDQATYLGRSQRTLFDLRVAEFVVIDAHVYSVSFTDGSELEAIVNGEFEDEASARVEAEQFGRYVGQLPAATRVGVSELWIHRGEELWGSSDNALIIHTDMTRNYDQAGILEETLLHESVHVSLDAVHENSTGWRVAQASDENYISTYARENELTEDLAETFVMWLALRYMGDLSEDNRARIEASVPARVQYLDQQQFDVSPFTP